MRYQRSQRGEPLCRNNNYPISRTGESKPLSVLPQRETDIKTLRGTTDAVIT
jgi:hypothetical protein